MTSTKGGSLATGDARTSIVVDANSSMGPISPLLYGTNHRYPYNGFNMWNPKSRAPYQLFLKRFQQAGFTAVRYPGGRTANNYHWKRAIGPMAERGRHVDSAFGRTPIHGQTLTNEFGPDEFGQLLGATGTEGSIVANFATASAAETADWVEYMNTEVGDNPHGGVAWAKVRAANGHPAPYGIKYWEIGNELAGEKTFWLGGDTTLTERAAKYIFGGSTFFQEQPAHRALDYSPHAAFSSGHPSQDFYVAFPPARPNLTVFVDGVPWEEVENLEAVGASNAYEFDALTGRIEFGDGKHGAIPTKGTRVTITYVSGPHDGFVDFYREMNETDPSIKVGAALNSPQFISLMGQDRPYDFLVAHSYSFFRETPSNIRELHDLMMYLPDTQASKVTQTKSLIETELGPEQARGTDVVISEWAMAGGADIGLGRIDSPLRYTETLDSALYVGSVLKHWIDLDIPLAEKHSLIDIDPEKPPKGYSKIRSAFQGLIGPYPCFVLSASALVFRLFSFMMGDNQVAAQVLENPTKTIFNGAPLPALAVVAGTDNSALYLVVVNRSSRRNVSAEIRTEGFHQSGTAVVWTLNGSSTLSRNSENHPGAVAIEESTYKGMRDVFTYAFPAHSITAIKLLS